jgi:hypothetical protein
MNAPAEADHKIKAHRLDRLIQVDVFIDAGPEILADDSAPNATGTGTRLGARRGAMLIRLCGFVLETSARSRRS